MCISYLQYTIYLQYAETGNFPSHFPHIAYTDRVLCTEHISAGLSKKLWFNYCKKNNKNTAKLVHALCLFFVVLKCVALKRSSQKIIKALYWKGAERTQFWLAETLHVLPFIIDSGTVSSKRFWYFWSVMCPKKNEVNLVKYY